ncbi:MAG TPA: hypothetical protein PKA82_00305 [Pyrinomonadaceae bacterium]|nr:hypothetical protein [Pyrinomonadaceae bacterium]
MKVVSLIVFLLIASCISFGQTSQGVDLKVNNVVWNSSYATVLKQLGKPLKTKKSTMKAGNNCTGDAQTMLELTYKGLEISLIGDGRGRGMRVYGMAVKDARWLASGIRIGTDVDGVKGEFGKPDYESIDDGTTKFLYNATEDTTEVWVEFRNGKVVGIFLAESLC